MPLKRPFVVTVEPADSVRPGQLYKNSCFLVQVIGPAASRQKLGHRRWSAWRALVLACYDDRQDSVGTSGQWGFPLGWELVSDA